MKASYKHTLGITLTILTLVFSALGSGTAKAATSTRLFGTTGNGATGGTSTLVELDPTNGSLIQAIGPVGYLVDGLDYDPVSGKLYATTSRNDPTFQNGLLTIDMTSGAGTPIGTGNPGFGSVNNLRADPAGDLFAWNGTGCLLAVDPSTGVASLVGCAGFYVSYTGASFDSSGTYYMVNYYGGTGNIYTVDTATGAVTFTGHATGAMVHHADFNPDTGKFWGIDTSGAGAKNIRVVDIATGTVEQTLPTIDNLHTLAFVKGAPADTTPPTVETFTATSPSSSLNIPITAFSASDDTGVTGYLITQSTTPPSADDPGWSATAPNTYTVPGPGEYFLYPWARDAAGNVSARFFLPPFGWPTDVRVCGSSITVTSNADDGAGSLRKAISDVCAGGTIDFDNDYTILLSSQLTIDKDLTTDGGTHTVLVDGQNAVRVFLVNSGVTAKLQNLTIQKGHVAGTDAAGKGGGILNLGNLTVAKCAILQNFAASNGSAGGGISNAGTLAVVKSLITGNKADDFPGYRGGSGAGLDNRGNATVTNSTFSGNTAQADGGGISNWAQLTVTGSTFTENSATDNGGGLYNWGTLTLENDTVWGNSSTTGGGILNGNGTLTLINSTLAGNSATTGGGLYNSWGMPPFFPQLNFTNTIIANSTSGGDCYSASSIATAEHNLVQDGSCLASLSGDPKLDSNLGNNGGDTQTVALLPGSIAVDAGTNSGCPDIDQRGISRPQGALCDIGAYELEPSPAKAITAFDFTSPAATGVIDETAHTIALTVPFGTDVTNPVPTITITGASVNPDSGVAHDFTSPVTYTVTAANGTTQDYLVTVTVALNPAKAITAFDFTSPAATGVIDETAHTIALAVPFGTSVTNLVPTITITGASVNPDSGLAQDFTNPVTYTVTAADGTTQDYQVTVSVGSNSAPLITEGAAVAVTMSEDRAPTPFALTLHATDADHDTLTWSILTPASFGTAGIASGSGVASYLPLPNYNGSDAFVVQVSDGNGGSDSITVNVTIQAVVDPMIYNQSYAIQYDTWLGVSDAHASGGGYRHATSGSFTFNPGIAFTQIKWITYRGPNQGKAQVLVDGVVKATIDLYNAQPQWKYLVTITGLVNAKHTVVIKPLNTRNVKSTDKWVSVDGFTIGATRFEDNLIANSKAQLSYGSWLGLVTADTGVDGYRLSSVKNATLSFSFDGMGFDWATARGRAYGKAAVYVDGVLVQTVDLYSASQAWYTLAVHGLAYGHHTVIIKVLGTKNAQSTGTGVVFNGVTPN